MSIANAIQEARTVRELPSAGTIFCSGDGQYKET